MLALYPHPLSTLFSKPIEKPAFLDDMGPFSINSHSLPADSPSSIAQAEQQHLNNMSYFSRTDSSSSNDTHSEASSSPSPLTLIISTHRAKPHETAVDLEYDLNALYGPPSSPRLSQPGPKHRRRSSNTQYSRLRGSIDRASRDITARMNRMQQNQETSQPQPFGEAPQELRVGCIYGRDVSGGVAFAEMLATQDWPADWRVQVSHDSPSHEDSPPPRRRSTYMIAGG